MSCPTAKVSLVVRLTKVGDHQAVLSAKLLSHAAVKHTCTLLLRPTYVLIVAGDLRLGFLGGCDFCSLPIADVGIDSNTVSTISLATQLCVALHRG